MPESLNDLYLAENKRLLAQLEDILQQFAASGRTNRARSLAVTQIENAIHRIKDDMAELERLNARRAP